MLELTLGGQKAGQYAESEYRQAILDAQNHASCGLWTPGTVVKVQEVGGDQRLYAQFTVA